MWDDNLRFLRKMPSVLFALLVMLLTCLFHFRSLDIVIPRYLAESVIGKGWSLRVYVLRILCLLRHAPPPTQPLTCHVNDVFGYGTFRPGSVLARKNMDVSAKSMDVSANKI